MIGAFGELKSQNFQGNSDTFQPEMYQSDLENDGVLAYRTHPIFVTCLTWGLTGFTNILKSITSRFYPYSHSHSCSQSPIILILILLNLVLLLT